MNDRILKVYVIPVEDNFIHLSSKLLRELNVLKKFNHSVCLKVTIIDSKLEDFYSSYSQTPYNSNGDYAFNISHELLSTMRLKKSQNVLITPIDQVSTLKFIHVTPVTNEDWDLLMINNFSLQENILQQIHIINKNQIIPIWVSKFVHLKIFIDNLENDMQFGLLKEFTEIIINSNIITPDKNLNKKNKVKHVDDNMNIRLKYQDNIIPITKYHHKLICRTIILDETLVKSSQIYPYCAFISKLHMSMLYKNYSSHKSGFVKISLLPELNKINDKKSKIENQYLVLRLCPLDSSMNNVDKMEFITWPTIYLSKLLFKIMNLKMNSKVILKPLSTIDNDICEIKNIYISPIKEMNIDEGEMLIDCLLKQLKNEIMHHKVLILNNFSLLKVIYNKILTIDVLIIFSKSNIPYIFLNEYNFGFIKFTNQFDNKILDNCKNLFEKINQTQINNFTFDTSALKNYDLKCFKEISKFGSLCLKIGLNSFSVQSKIYFEYDNLLIIGSVASGKTISAKLLCQKFSKCPYFVKIIWINGRSYAGKLWETFQKQLINHFQECLYYQPAIIVIDDLDELCHLNNEPNDQPDIFKAYLRPLYLLMRIIENYTNNNYCIRVICTSKPINEENEDFIMKELKYVFKTVMHIPIINKENRKMIITKYLNNVKFDRDINDKILLSICEKMNNYVIQDLIDYCDKVLFETIKNNSILNNTILNNVFEKYVPLSLHNVKISKEKKFNFSLIGGMNNVKQIITETIIWPSIYPDVFSKCPLKLESGVLLYGAPGTGKTLLARSVIGESNLNFISVNGPELLSKYVGESENNLRKIFQRAQNAKPCIIFFDEFDSISTKRGSDQTGVTDRIVNQFLTQLDGVSIFDGVWVIAATSRPDMIDEALLRPGRIGVKLHCELPSAKDREDILKIICKKVTLSTDVNFHDISALTMNYTGADLNGLLYTAISIAEKRLLEEQYDVSSEHDTLREPIITAVDFQDALKITKPSLHQIDINRYAQMHKIFSRKKIVDQNDEIDVFEVDVNDGNREKQQKLTYA